MRPIHLKIKGLNSFEEQQEIDFSRLVSTGLFGIFGPTGSGKSTVIDAITLALYGRISRYTSERDMDFINSECDGAYVYFEFKLSNDHYVVERSFVREVGKSKFSGGRFYRKPADSNGEIQVISDTRKTLNEEIERTLGLKYSDFSRTVILPQHKFSEFLLMQNMERRTMLEHIFNLEKYGEAMYRRVKNKLDEVNLIIRDADNLLTSYGDITEELLAQKTAEYIDGLSELENLRKRAGELSVESAEALKLKELNDERIEHEKTLARLKLMEPGMAEKRRILAQGEKADIIKPFVTVLEDTADKISKNETALKLCAEKYEKLEAQLRSAEEKHLALRKEREEWGPILARGEIEAARALALKPEIAQLEEELAQLRKSYESTVKKIKELTDGTQSATQEDLEEMAAILAAELTEGAPCPVCGSTSHPQKAVSARAEQENEPINLRRSVDQQKLTALETEKGIVKVRGVDKKTALDKLTDQLNQLTGGKHPETLLTEIKNKSAAFVESENRARHQCEELRIRYQEAALALAECRQLAKTLTEIFDSNKAKLIALLPENSFESVEEAMKAVVPAKKRQEITDELRSYDQSVASANGVYARVSSKLTGVDTENINEKSNILQKEFLDLSKNIERKGQLYAIMKSQTEKLADDLKKISDLTRAQTINKRRASLLMDLESLLKGKKFIEFIAAQKLSYITAEATRRFKEMSSGRYAFELMDTEFVIRDDHCGGRRRSPKTLSGGETFIASLCLALALSSRIQLKNNAPLEFFFLDEGFGSLDATSLDMVMDCLERLRLEKMSVGIITHIEEVKNRIPAKLQVTPAEQGMHGAKVTLEL